MYPQNMHELQTNPVIHHPCYKYHTNTLFMYLIWKLRSHSDENSSSALLTALEKGNGEADPSHWEGKQVMVISGGTFNHIKDEQDLYKR